jgi:hypothetical protein
MVQFLQKRARSRRAGLQFGGILRMMHEDLLETMRAVDKKVRDFSEGSHSNPGFPLVPRSSLLIANFRG